MFIIYIWYMKKVNLLVSIFYEQRQLIAIIFPQFFYSLPEESEQIWPINLAMKTLNSIKSAIRAPVRRHLTSGTPAPWASVARAWQIPVATLPRIKPVTTKTIKPRRYPTLLIFLTLSLRYSVKGEKKYINF